ncbi:50S ribosomal protein L24 [Mucilaginibacter jinjuensis]|uniref:Large ribosomal subunit protein uL24 n=1 Tax=Mucilaginibacter jinjuensis TaxID=1176721 RepID=A0ABY7TFR7_9SPHI|nr:50S ribosomal protein L24 [Mucilaginibacter jinjuensis]WCT15079.1 50S ribosomal protein L24 [Mucilaginibacter jinjuensis]
MKIRKGDTVKVIAGDSKGSQGKITEINLATSRAKVEGVNLVSKHTKPNAANPNGGIVKQEAAIHISNLALVDPKTGETTRVGRKKNDAGKLVRVSKKSGEEIK